MRYACSMYVEGALFRVLKSHSTSGRCIFSEIKGKKGTGTGFEIVKRQ